MDAEQSFIVSRAREQGGFTAEQWDRYCELDNIRMAPVIAQAYRNMEMTWFRFNERHFLFSEGAD